MKKESTQLKMHQAVTVDVVVFTIEDEKLKVLLIEREDAPYKGTWALPGSFLRKGETAGDAVARTLKEKVGITGVYVEQLYTFDNPKRDPRGHVLSVSYVALVNRSKIKIQESATTQHPELHKINKLPKLAFDHEDVVKYALERLRYKLEYTNVAYALLPTRFPLTELHRAYEIILGKHIDKRNFRKKVLSLDLVRATRQVSTGGKHRPATLYEFKSRKPVILKRFF